VARADKIKEPPTPCPCGGADYDRCCAPYHNGTPAPDAVTLMEPLAIRLGRQQTAANALVIMRSRYSAYVLKLEDYLLSTWHASTRPVALNLAADQTKWLGLKIISHDSESVDKACVEFVARYKFGGRAQRMHEISRFVREQGQWFYLDGDFPG
jgi:SEC-C motif-containing protein